MKKAKREQLERTGWRLGNAGDFLGLSAEETAYIELKLALGQRLKTAREKKGVTQTDLAKLARSSQSRVAKMEAGDPSVSMDLIVKTLLAMGVSRKQIASTIAKTSDCAA
ncbi:MAG: helix-turn-helix transcriptional regulator [Gammaproteobacteria bacterium]|nr:helix-turn-helix transcriptional regulator [Gammaproteobacteria bacterium]